MGTRVLLKLIRAIGKYKRETGIEEWTATPKPFAWSVCRSLQVSRRSRHRDRRRCSRDAVASVAAPPPFHSLAPGPSGSGPGAVCNGHTSYN